MEIRPDDDDDDDDESPGSREKQVYYYILLHFILNCKNTMYDIIVPINRMKWYRNYGVVVVDDDDDDMCCIRNTVPVRKYFLFDEEKLQIDTFWWE